MGKYIKIDIIIAVFLVLVGIIWYHQPIQKEIFMTSCSLEGDVIEVKLDVAWYRYLLAPTDLKGTITIDDVVYQSLKVNESDSFFEKIKKKMNNTRRTPVFANLVETKYTLEYDIVFLEHIQKKFEKICIVVQKGDISTTYYGPATTKEEAKEISKELLSEE